MVDFNKIKEATEKRDQFLKENPQLQPLQDKINELCLGKTNYERQVIIQQLMLNTWYEVVNVWEKK